MRSRHTPDVAPSRREAAAGMAAGVGVALVLALGVASGGTPSGYAVPASLSASASPAVAAAGAAGVDPVAASRPVVAASASSPSPMVDPVDCASGRGRPAQHGSIGGLVLGMAGLLCGPLGPAGGLPPTALEEQEPRRLYALVTRDRGVVPVGYAPDDLVPLPGGLYEARAEVAAQLRALMGAARAEGHDYLAVTSGFRDHDTQAGTHEDWVRRLGAERAEQVSALPGHSEHQLGLAIDVTGECGGFDCFGDSDDGRWVAANAHRFGFIIRYPEGGEEVTGYAYEPWHLRYVGPRAAWAMHLRGEVYWEDFAPVALKAAAPPDR
jgi:zinc D-Ala-D-Ala carboxypeptidase